MNEKSFKLLIARFLKEKSNQRENKFIEDFENYLIDKNQTRVFKNKEHKLKIKNEIYQVVNNHIQKKEFPWYRIAAVLVIMIGITFFTLYHNYSTDRNYLSFQTKNSPEFFILPDSSTVWLNSHSKFSFSKNFKNFRKTKLFGEAFFNVKKNPNKPFTVAFSEHEVLVTGTQFKIINRFKKFQEVSVKEGSVRVSSNIDTSDYDLMANNYLKISAGSFMKETKAFSDKGFWIPERLIIDNIPLKEVLNLVGERYNLSIVVSEETSPNLQKKITANYSGTTSIYDLVNGLILLTPYQYEIDVNRQELRIR